MVRPERVELPTFWFVAKRSIQLSYGRIAGELRLKSLQQHLRSVQLRLDADFSDPKNIFEVEGWPGRV